MANDENYVSLGNLARYDEKIKDKIAASTTGDTVQAEGTAPIKLAAEALSSGGTKVTGELMIGAGLRVDAQTGKLLVKIDNNTIGLGSSGLYVINKETQNLALTNKPSTGTVSAFYHQNTVCVTFGGVKVAGNSKTLVGKLPSTYYPDEDVTGYVLASGSSSIVAAYCKVETDGRIYINPVYSSSAGLLWSGTLTFLI